MKSTGVVRPIDNLGRFVLPKEIRDTLDISPKDPLEVYVDADRIILKKYTPSCIFCTNAEEVTYYKGKLVCSECIDNLKNSQIWIY